MFKGYFKIALRSLWKAKGITALNIVGLGIGLACASIIAAWSLNEFSYDRYHSEHDRIFRLASNIQTDSETFAQAVTAPPLATALLSNFPEIESAVRLDQNDCIVEVDHLQAEEDGVLFVDHSFFEVFDFTLMQGDPSTALREPFTIVLTESMARKYFPVPGDPAGYENPLGKSMKMYIHDRDGTGALYTITGIVADPPANSHFTFNILGAFSTYEATRQGTENAWFRDRFYTYLLLNPGTDPQMLEQKLPQFAERHIGAEMAASQTFYSFFLQPLEKIYLQSGLRKEIGPTGNLATVIIFISIGLLILLAACINYVNLATARSLSRAREVGVRKVMGAPRSQLIRQFLLESIVVALASFLFAIFLFELAGPFFPELTANQFSPELTPEILGLMLLLTLLAGLAAGLYPALYISSFREAEILKGSFKTSPAGIRLRRGLVIVQFSIAIVLLAGIAVVKGQLDFIRNKDLGFDRRALLTLKVNGFAEVQDNFEPFKNELLSNALVGGVSRSRGSIGGGVGNTLIETIDGSGKAISANISRHRVDQDFLSVYNIDLLAGRQFSRADSTGGYIVNEAAVSAFGWGSLQQAIGKPIRHGDGSGAVIGVVRDFHHDGLHEAITPMVIYLTQPTAFSRITIRLESTDYARAIAFVEESWRSHFPGALFQYRFMDQALENQYLAEKQFGSLFSVFVMLSIIIACLGLLGLASHAVQERTREIGIRKVFGATVTSLILLIGKDFFKLVLFANLIALPIAWYIMRNWLANFAYRIDLDWWVFLLAGGLVMIIALLTVSTQAFRAAILNPARSLRQE